MNKPKKVFSKVKKGLMPIDVGPKDKSDSHESTRLSIMAGVVATAVAGFALFFPGASNGVSLKIPVSTSLVLGVMMILAVLSLSYIMLTGLAYAYPAGRKEYVGLPRPLEWLRQKTYNASVKFYWISFIMIIYYIIAKIIGMSYEQSIAVLYNILAIAATFIVLPLAVVAIIVKAIRKGEQNE